MFEVTTSCTIGHMNLKVKQFLTVGLMLLSTVTANAEPTIDSSKAAFHVGSQAMVCGVVAQVRPFAKGTYLNMGGRYPNQHITVVVWSTDEPAFKSRFGQLSTTFQGARACARGLIGSYKNSLQIEVSNPQFLRLMK